MWGLFAPKRTPLSVIKELVEGFDAGTVVFPWPEEVTEIEEPSLNLDVAPMGDGPFVTYLPTTFGAAHAPKRRNAGETVRVSGLLVDAKSIGEVCGYAPV